MPVYNLIEYSDNYSKTYGLLWPYYRDEVVLTAAGAIDNFPGKSASVKFKWKITVKIENNGWYNGHIMVLLKYSENLMFEEFLKCH